MATQKKKINESTHGHLSGQQIRNRQAREAAGDKVAKLWAELCDNDPQMVELLLPEKLRAALGELVRATQNPPEAS